MIHYMIQICCIVIGVFMAYILITITYEGAICAFGMRSSESIQNTYQCLLSEFNIRIKNFYAFRKNNDIPVTYNTYTLQNTNVFTSDDLLNEHFQTAWRRFLSNTHDYFYVVSKTGPIKIKFGDYEASASNDSQRTISISKGIVVSIINNNKIQCKDYF